MPNADQINSIDWCPYLIILGSTNLDGTTITGGPNWILRPKKKTVFFRRIRIQPVGGTVATVARLFLNNGDDHTNPSNNILIQEATMPTTSPSTTVRNAYVPITINFWLPAGYRFNILFEKPNSAGKGFYVSAIAGQYSGELSDPTLYQTA